MADSERRYGPTIDLQGFDLKTDMDAVDAPSRLSLLVVIALVVLAAFAGVVWLAYTQGVERGRDSVSRELVAQGIWKTRKPDVPAYTGLKIYEQPSATGQTASAAPPKGTTNAIPALRPTASAAPDNPAPSDRVAARPPTTAARGTISNEHPQSAAALATPAGTKSQPERVATRAPTELTKPATAPIVPAHPILSPDASPPAPQAVPSAASTPVAPAILAPARPVAPASGVVLQIGSYKSEAEARQSWSAFKAEHDAAAGYQPDVRQVDLGAKGTWYRLRMGPFADKESALEICQKLKADGASCLLSR
jgi:cell division protein FtsN